MAYKNMYSKTGKHEAESRNPKYKDKTDKELFKEFQVTRDAEIRSELINRNLFIAEILAKKYINKGIEYEDILQVASLGLILAVDRFDVDKGYEFTSFSTPTIIGEIKKHFRDKGWAIRVPRKVQELSKKVNMAKVHLQSELGRVPTFSDISVYLEVPEEEIMEAMEASQAFKLKSLDVNYENSNDDKSLAFMDMIGDEDKNFDEFENRDYVRKALEKLDDEERKVIIERFFHQKTQMEIAKEMGISQMTVSRMEKKILSKLKADYMKQT